MSPQSLLLLTAVRVAIPNHRHIFLIGFNKCGTTSFHDYFKANGISSVHWRANTLALTMQKNHNEGHPLLMGLDRWTAYTDMICIPGSPWGQSNTGAAPLIENRKMETRFQIFSLNFLSLSTVLKFEDSKRFLCVLIQLFSEFLLRFPHKVGEISNFDSELRESLEVEDWEWAEKYLGEYIEDVIWLRTDLQIREDVISTLDRLDISPICD